MTVSEKVKLSRPEFRSNEKLVRVGPVVSSMTATIGKASEAGISSAVLSKKSRMAAAAIEMKVLFTSVPILSSILRAWRSGTAK